MNIENHWSESFQYTVYKTGVQWMAFKDSHTPTDGVEVSVIYNVSWRANQTLTITVRNNAVEAIVKRCDACSQYH